MNKNTCFALISGPPGIGKTTFCKALREFALRNGDKFENYFLTPIWICYDEIIDKNIELELISQNLGNWKKSRNLIQNLTTHLADYLNQACSINEFNLNDYTKTLNLFNKDENLNEKLIENFIRIIEKQSNQFLTNASQGKECFLVFILDDIFYYENMRYVFFKSALEANYSSYYSLCFKAKDIDFLLCRNNTRNPDAKLSESIIRNIFEKFEYPNLVTWEKKFSKCELVDKKLDFSETIFDDFVATLLQNHKSFLIFKKQKLHLKEIEEKNRLNGETSSQNLVHKCDLILRKLIKESIYKANNSDLKMISQKLNAQKALILEKLKNPQSEIHMKFFSMANSNELEIELSKLLNVVAC